MGQEQSSSRAGTSGASVRQVASASRGKGAPMERMNAFSDGAFAVIITVLVLDLRPPHGDTFAALLTLWPTALGYAVSYLFIAIVWINHHYVIGFAKQATQRLVWLNFAHLFTVSLTPFSTAWVAESRLGALPVATYAAVFVLVNLTYVALCWEAIDSASDEGVPERLRGLLGMRSVITLAVFVVAGILALRFPIIGMSLIAACLLVYTRPDASARQA